jgi:hypothetical protein
MKMTDVVGLIDEKAAEVAIVRHGLAGQGDSRYFNSLLHAGQYDMIPALAFSGFVCFRGRVTLSITIATAAARGIGR